VNYYNQGTGLLPPLIASADVDIVERYPAIDSIVLLPVILTNIDYSVVPLSVRF
jgi:hypothetical protein